MKKLGLKGWLIIAVLVIVAAAAAIHLTTRTQVPEGKLLVAGTEINLSGLALQDVKGTLVNGKGDEIPVDAKGVAMSAVLASAGITEYSQITVCADDEYSAAVSREEVSAPEKVYLVLQDEGGVKMVVFGDSNSKRNVSDVVRIDVQ